MRLLFRDGSKETGEFAALDTLMVNQDRQIVVNPMEDLDEQEKIAVLTDIMNADPVQNELNVVSQRWHEVESWFGGSVNERISGYDCRKFKVQVEAQVRQKKKVNTQFDQTYE